MFYAQALYSYSQEFEGFFMDEEPEETEGNGIIKHDNIKDLHFSYIFEVYHQKLNHFQVQDKHYQDEYLPFEQYS